MVGMGGAIYDSHNRGLEEPVTTFAITLGPRSEQNEYVAELEAIVIVARTLLAHLTKRQITIMTST